MSPYFARARALEARQNRNRRTENNLRMLRPKAPPMNASLTYGNTARGNAIARGVQISEGATHKGTARGVVRSCSNSIFWRRTPGWMVSCEPGGIHINDTSGESVEESGPDSHRRTDLGMTPPRTSAYRAGGAGAEREWRRSGLPLFKFRNSRGMMEAIPQGVARAAIVNNDLETSLTIIKFTFRRRPGQERVVAVGRQQTLGATAHLPPLSCAAVRGSPACRGRKQLEPPLSSCGRSTGPANQDRSRRRRQFGTHV